MTAINPPATWISKVAYGSSVLNTRFFISSRISGRRFSLAKFRRSADFHFENHIPKIKELFDYNRKRGRRIGFLPTMEVIWHRSGILQQVDKIKHVFSVDLVLDPATNEGIIL